MSFFDSDFSGEQNFYNSEKSVNNEISRCKESN